MVTPRMGHCLRPFEGTERAEFCGGEPESRGWEAAPLLAEILECYHLDALQQCGTPTE